MLLLQTAGPLEAKPRRSVQLKLWSPAGQVFHYFTGILAACSNLSSWATACLRQMWVCQVYWPAVSNLGIKITWHKVALFLKIGSNCHFDLLVSVINNNLLQSCVIHTKAVSQTCRLQQYLILYLTEHSNNLLSTPPCYYSPANGSLQ